MQKNPGVRDYRSTQILSSRPERLILLLYDGAIKFIHQGQQALEKEQLEQAHNSLIRAQNILVELMGSLNFEKGGEIASNLFRIYEFMHYTLVQANIKKKPEPLGRICEQLKQLRESWFQALKNEESGKETAAPGKNTGEDQKKGISIKG